MPLHQWQLEKMELFPNVSAARTCAATATMLKHKQYHGEVIRT